MIGFFAFESALKNEYALLFYQSLTVVLYNESNNMKEMDPL